MSRRRVGSADRVATGEEVRYDVQDSDYLCVPHRVPEHSERDHEQYSEEYGPGNCHLCTPWSQISACSYCSCSCNLKKSLDRYSGRRACTTVPVCYRCRTGNGVEQEPSLPVAA